MLRALLRVHLGQLLRLAAGSLLRFLNALVLVALVAAQTVRDCRVHFRLSKHPLLLRLGLRLGLGVSLGFLRLVLAEQLQIHLEKVVILKHIQSSV